VTGPTGSGKTTTLYGCLHFINKPDRKIITVEDPVEYQLNGINQVPVRHDVGMTFASALRAMLRQAPNIVMVGEIRDLETAEIAINASLTGHMVFSTLHTNDAPGAVTRPDRYRGEAVPGVDLVARGDGAAACSQDLPPLQEALHADNQRAAFA
jgi:general secretion pathway protein E/type IV pilus assembly protein PilB